MKLLPILDNLISEGLNVFQPIIISYRVNIPIYHTVHSFKNKNRKDYTHDYDVDKRPIDNIEIIDLIHYMLPKFIQKVADQQIREYTTILADSEVSTVKMIISLERVKHQKNLFNWLLKLVTIRRNKLDEYSGQIIINEYNKLEQRLDELIIKVPVTFTINITFTKQILNSLSNLELQECHKLLESNQNQIVRWLKMNNPNNKQKIEFPINTKIIRAYFEIKTPFEFEIKIIDIK